LGQKIRGEMQMNKIYVFQYINDLEQREGIPLDCGEHVDIRAVNEPRAWDEFKEWARINDETVVQVELIEVEDYA
jgi:hypothetical protein